MGIPVVDFSNVDGKGRADTLTLIDRYCQEWGFFQLINHGISKELLDRVKKVATECYKLEREAGFKNSKPVQLLNELVEKNSDAKIENVDWEDVFLLSDENDEEWPSKTIGFKETMKEYRAELKKLGHKVMEIMDENLVINTGDQIEVLSNGRYKSILHRVVPQTDGQRRSIASFYNPSLKATIQPAPQLLDTKVENKVKDVAKVDFIVRDVTKSH
ncbi:UNVERIFIED_CONTAM: 1-aminocyclopropane-1-carboxylate oxidase [Sesamum calycinum]|uniref:1-aminocyclopropane-1-carboxylate oxidase n=1 Tax=Sesamum calycinum TaxID=2727403 RepID=A0AAW2IVN0_9LAMI